MEQRAAISIENGAPRSWYHKKYLKIPIPNLPIIVLVLFKYSKSFKTFLYLQGKPPSRGAFQPNEVCDSPPQTSTYLRTHTRVPKLN